MKGKALTIAGLCVLAVALALPASIVAAGQPLVQPLHGTFGPFEQDVCGIGGFLETDTISGVAISYENGAVQVDGVLLATIVNPANGKTVERRAAFGGPAGKGIDNGNGTFSVLVRESGMETIFVPNGGPHILTAGEIAFLLTIDSTTGQLVGFEVLQTGGSGPSFDFGTTDVCPFYLSALT
jgi:hypothetical protein